MTTHACPACQHQHEPPTFMAAVVALTAVASAAEKTGAQILSAGTLPGYISVRAETEDGLRALASQLGLPEPGWGGLTLETKGSYAGANVTILHRARAAS